jgi:hypothetical protein
MPPFGLGVPSPNLDFGSGPAGPSYAQSGISGYAGASPNPGVVIQAGGFGNSTPSGTAQWSDPLLRPPTLTSSLIDAPLSILQVFQQSGIVEVLLLVGIVYLVVRARGKA